jgi:hypothetical protein
MNHFFEGPESQIITLCIYADGFNFFGALLWRKWKFKFLLAFMKTLTILKILTETLFKMLVAAFRKPLVIL